MSSSSSPPPKPPGHSFLELAHAYRDFILRTAKKHGVMPADAEDVAQLVLHALWQEVQRRGLPKNVRGWLLVVTRRIALAHHHGKLGWRIERPDDRSKRLEDLGPSSEQLCLAREKVWLVRELLAGLRPERAEVLRRHELWGDKLVHIAKEQGIPLGTVHTRLRLARLDFKAAYERWLKRQESEERIGAVALPFAFLAEQQSRAPAVAPSGSIRLAISWQAMAVWLLVLLTTLDTRFPCGSPELAAIAGLTAEGAPRALGAAEPVSREVPVTVVAPPVVSAPVSVDESRRARPGAVVPVQPREAPPKHSRDLETARIHLHVAAQMAAENRPDLADQALHGYEVRAPDNPLPRTKAALQSELRPAVPSRQPSPGAR